VQQPLRKVVNRICRLCESGVPQPLHEHVAENSPKMNGTSLRSQIWWVFTLQMQSAMELPLQEQGLALALSKDPLIN
jgi:hypothetical protein